MAQVRNTWVQQVSLLHFFSEPLMDCCAQGLPSLGNPFPLAARKQTNLWRVGFPECPCNPTKILVEQGRVFFSRGIFKGCFDTHQ